MDVLFRAPFFATFGARLGDVLVISPLWVLVRVSPFHAKPSALDDFNHGVLFSPLGSCNFWRFLSCTHGVLVLDAPGLATRWQSHQIKPVGRQMRDHGHMSSRPVRGPCMTVFFVRGYHLQQTEGLLARLPLLLCVSVCCSLALSLRFVSSVSLCRVALRLQTTRCLCAFGCHVQIYYCVGWQHATPRAWQA
jgi:hypothetical protein